MIDRLPDAPPLGTPPHAPVLRLGSPASAGELIQRIRDSTDRLEADCLDAGDLKILSRSIRELRRAFNVFAPYRGCRKATVFGSARTPPADPAYVLAVELGRRLAEAGWMVITGAGGGIMQAGHEGAGREASLGLNILLPFEQSANPVIAGDPKLVSMKYFFTRKLMFVKECDGVVSLPGGFGTLDEAMEVLTLVQTGKRELLPMVMLDAPGQGYWQDWLAFIERHLHRTGLISPPDLSLFRVTSSVDEAVDELLGFYRVYHSMRYVGQRLVLRLNRRISEQTLARLNDAFTDILVSGAIEQTDRLAEEADENGAAKLPRLVLHFDRKNHGRLRELVNVVNAE
ncbi:LOG family protein YvdD [Pirellulimonas nuda]|uniref:AMP nucleosidase n=1 Tax=Pirellulimonas nuda TaxID=2528009 RepID=A0A518D6J1_9BACT|nr:TIGR00730 family Rossman fold protein [Pirellulimonas nuda]QDU87100.1 LOG family protein YvdD [Pirellulimonas nuda]